MKTMKRILIIAFVAIVTTSCCDCPSGDFSAIQIDSDEALDLEQRYVNNQYEIINQTFPEDAREVLFTDLDALQSFLYKVRDEGETRSLNNVGVRVYFGAKELDGTSTATVFLAGVAAPNVNQDPTDDPDDPYPLPEDFMTMAIFANKGSMGNNNLIPIESELINPE